VPATNLDKTMILMMMMMVMLVLVVITVAGGERTECKRASSCGTDTRQGQLQSCFVCLLR